MLQVACANGKGINKTYMLPNSIFKSSQNRCGNNAQKSDARKDGNMRENLSQNVANIQKHMLKIHSEFDAKI